jgi:hypothetical protein
MYESLSIGGIASNLPGFSAPCARRNSRYAGTLRRAWKNTAAARLRLAHVRTRPVMPGAKRRR